MNNDEARGREQFKIAYYVSNRDIQLLVLRITSYNFEIASIGHFLNGLFVLSEVFSFFYFFFLLQNKILGLKGASSHVSLSINFAEKKQAVGKKSLFPAILI